MKLKGQIISVTADSYKGSKGTLDNSIVVCLDAEDVKLVNTFDVKVPTEDLKLLGKIEPNRTVANFDVTDIEFFRNRCRMVARVVVYKGV